MQTNVTVNITSWPLEPLVVELAPIILAIAISAFVTLVGHWKRSPVAYAVASVMWFISGAHVLLNPTIVPANVGFVLILIGLMYLALAIAEFMLPGFRRLNYYDRARQSYRRRISRK